LEREKFDRPTRPPRQTGNDMRLFVSALVVTAGIYFWDKLYNNGTLFDGLNSMTRSMAHSFFP
jgi:hypothetical protein